MLGGAELATLEEVLEGTEYKAALDEKAQKVLDFYKDAIEQNPPVPNVETMVKTGHPAEVIVQTAIDEDVAMILIGSRGQRGSARLLMGSVSREVANTADRPVLLVK
jgi:nucleotide-binding universal stress UspA family protein